jgi:hypothetical protein
MRKIWVKTPGPLKLTAEEKTVLLERVRSFVVDSKNLAPVTYRIDLENGRVFLYFLHQPATFTSPNVYYPEPLKEVCFARITLFNSEGSECAAEWQRQEGQWVTAAEGTLEVCLKSIEDKNKFRILFAGLNVKRSPDFPIPLNKDS